MTRVTIDASTAARLHGLGEYLEFYDEAGNLLGRFEPNENSPAVREWLKSLESELSEEEIARRTARWDGLTTEEVVARLRGNAP